jgi:anti-sigma regulatory factor (Ser/Thr protein kinase)
VHWHGPGSIVTSTVAGRPMMRVFLGQHSQVARARNFVAQALAGFPAADDAVLLTSELAGNALLHTASGHGGTFRVVVHVARHMARVEVHDGGSDTKPDVRSPRAAGESGAGLFLVESLSARWGHDGGPDGRVVWFEMEAGMMAESISATKTAEARYDPRLYVRISRDVRVKLAA